MFANRFLMAMSAAAFLIAWPSYLRANDPAGPAAIDVSLVTPDDFAAIVIRPRRIAQLPLLADLLKDQMVAGAIKKFDKIMEAFKKNAPPLVVAYLDAAKTVQGGTVTFNLTGPALVHVVLDAKDAAAAGNVEELLQQALRMAGGGLMLAKQSIPKDAQATLGPLVKLAEQLVDGAKTAKSGSQVTLDFKRPQILDTAGPSIVTTVRQSILEARAAARRDQQMNNMKQPELDTLQIKHRWVFTMTNLAREEALQKTLDLMKRARRAGYNGILVADSKFDKFQLQEKGYARNVRRLRQACTEAQMELIVPVCPMGYAAEFLAADPNLAEGMPVRNALFVVEDGKLAPRDDVARLVNGSLEQWKRGSPLGWTVDQPGTVSVKDEEILYDGRPTLRQDHSAAKRGVVRLMQTIKVQPWHYYHVSVMAKTEDCTSGDFRICAVGDAMKGYPLNWQPPAIHKTMDWTRLDATFASLDNREVGLYIGAYNAKGGKIWWSDVRIEPGGLVNVIRRPSLPLMITSEDGKTVYVEGKDFSEVKDPKLGNDPNPGYFTYWHEPPAVTVPEGSRLKQGERLLASYHFATLAGKSHQINCCLSEPKIYDLLARQAQWVKETAQPDFYMMAHDEIRHCGWDDSCTGRNMTCGQILAENVKRCAEIIEQTDPGKPILAWNDMFDPFHNARKEGWMYLAKGAGPWYGSWEGLPNRVLVANWHNNNAESLKFFADRGNGQILAGYYDADPHRITAWLEMAAKVKGVCGVMYTTWVNDYSQLERFMQIVDEFPVAQGAPGVGGVMGHNGAGTYTLRE